MSPAVRIALLGFTNFERDHLEAALRPGSEPSDEPGPVFLPGDDLAASNLALVNADDEVAVERVTREGRLLGTVMLGTTPRPGAAAQLNRPIHLVQLLRTLQDLVHRAPPMSAAVQRVHEDLARMRRRHRAAPTTRPADVRPASSPFIEGHPGSTRPSARPHLQPPRQALVVDDNEAVLRFLSRRLPRLGLEVSVVRNGAQALERAARQPFAFVFLATGLDGMDSFHTCRTLKRTAQGPAGAAPTVVMLLDQDVAVERLRAEMAGADACLCKPLDSAELLQLLGASAQHVVDEAATTRAAETLS